MDAVLVRRLRERLGVGRHALREALRVLNDAIELVQAMPGAPHGAQRLYTRIRVCIWFFCTHLDQVQDIRDRVSTVLRQLPEDIDPPIVSKFDNDSAPVITLSLSGDRTPRGPVLEVVVERTDVESIGAGLLQR